MNESNTEKINNLPYIMGIQAKQKMHEKNLNMEIYVWYTVYEEEKKIPTLVQCKRNEMLLNP